MNNTFSLKEIAEKTNCEITIDIPALQRGLVDILQTFIMERN